VEEYNLSKLGSRFLIHWSFFPLLISTVLSSQEAKQQYRLRTAQCCRVWIFSEGCHWGTVSLWRLETSSVPTSVSVHNEGHVNIADLRPAVFLFFHVNRRHMWAFQPLCPSLCNWSLKNPWFVFILFNRRRVDPASGWVEGSSKGRRPRKIHWRGENPGDTQQADRSKLLHQKYFVRI